MDERGERGKQTSSDPCAGSSTSAQNDRSLQANPRPRQGASGAGSSSGSSTNQGTRQPAPGVASSSANPSTSVRGQRSTSSNGNASISLRGQMGTSDRNTGPTQRGGGQSRGGRSRHQPQINEPPEGQVRRQGQLQRLATNPSHMVPSLQHQHAVQRQHGLGSTERTARKPTSDDGDDPTRSKTPTGLS